MQFLTHSTKTTERLKDYFDLFYNKEPYNVLVHCHRQESSSTTVQKKLKPNKQKRNQQHQPVTHLWAVFRIKFIWITCLKQKWDVKAATGLFSCNILIIAVTVSNVRLLPQCKTVFDLSPDDQFLFLDSISVSFAREVRSENGQHTIIHKLITVSTAELFVKFEKQQKGMLILSR